MFTTRFSVESNYKLLITAQPTLLYEYRVNGMNVEGVTAVHDVCFTLLS